MDIQGPYNLKLPAHELITQGSLIDAGILKPNQTYHDDYEYIRGVMWNDDPEGHFHYASGNVNKHLSTGIRWLIKFKYYHFMTKINSDLYCQPGAHLLARSHFGDMQFLHCMSANPSLDPVITQQQILSWAEFTYHIATGEIDQTEFVARVSVPGVAALFPEASRSGRETVGELFRIKKQYGDIKKRAIGSLLHMIQDSYSLGHTQRARNPDGTLGAILQFHNYATQAQFHHGTHDTFPKEIKYIRNLGGNNDALLMKIDGAIEAKIHGTTLLNLLQDRAKWTQEVAPFLKTVFAIAR